VGGKRYVTKPGSHLLNGSVPSAVHAPTAAPVTVSLTELAQRHANLTEAYTQALVIELNERLDRHRVTGVVVEGDSVHYFNSDGEVQVDDEQARKRVLEYHKQRPFAFMDLSDGEVLTSEELDKEFPDEEVLEFPSPQGNWAATFTLPKGGWRKEG